MTGTAEPLSGRRARFAAALEEWPRRTLRLDELWQVFSTADPASVGRPDRRAVLAGDLAALATAGLVSPSHSKDRSAQPPLPTRVVLPAPEASPTAHAMARSKAWRPELAWATSARLTVAQVHTLAAVNDWLRDHGDNDDVVPLRERSLEILGNEKALDRLIGTGLFGPGRLTLALLRTYRAHPPLPAVHIGSGTILLVVENADTFTTLLRCARQTPLGVGWVAWGAGAAFEASVRSVVDLRPTVTQVRYFGDLDYAGLRIPWSAARIAQEEQLPPVQPALHLYDQLLATRATQLVPASGAEPGKIDLVASWLADGSSAGANVAAHAIELLTAGHRIPQEALGTRQLVQRRTWAGC